MFYLVPRQHPALEPIHISSLGPVQLPSAALNAPRDPLSRAVARCGR